MRTLRQQIGDHMAAQGISRNALGVALVRAGLCSSPTEVYRVLSADRRVQLLDKITDHLGLELAPRGDEKNLQNCDPNS